MSRLFRLTVAAALASTSIASLFPAGAFADDGSRLKLSIYFGGTAWTNTNEVLQVQGQSVNLGGGNSGSVSPLLGAEMRFILSPYYSLGLDAEASNYGYQDGRVHDTEIGLYAVPRYTLGNGWFGVGLGVLGTYFGQTNGTAAGIPYGINSDAWGFAVSPRIGVDLPGGIGLQLEYTLSSFGVTGLASTGSSSIPFVDNVTRGWTTFAVRVNF